MKKITFFVLLVMTFTLKLFSQIIAPDQDFLLNLDYAQFQFDDQSGFLEIYYAFHPIHLTYNFTENKYHGGVILSTKIKDKKTNHFVVNEKVTLKISENDTGEVWYKFPFITKYNYVIPNGDYSLEVIALDSLGTARSDSIKLDLIITPYGDKLTSSDIELCKSIKSSNEKDGLFYKNSLEVVPFPSLFFGATTVPIMFHYVEIYNLDTSIEYTVRTEILDTKGSIVRQNSKKRNFPSSNSIEVGTTPTTSYLSGKFIFRLSLLDQNEELIFKTDKIFYIYNPHIELAITTPGQEELKALSDDELNQEFEVAKYLATDQEKQMFKQLNNYNAKLEFLLDFWSKVAKGRGDMPPIMRNEYITRVGIAKEKYKAWRKEGWETDQGRVFLVYSEPDEIERVPSVAESKPYEIWRYFNIEGGVEFIFVDIAEYNQLKLVHSTKRGELRDDNWQRYIQ